LGSNLKRTTDRMRILLPALLARETDRWVAVYRDLFVH
jgi:hypothetical protein